jgi:hypothetical protein
MGQVTDARVELERRLRQIQGLQVSPESASVTPPHALVLTPEVTRRSYTPAGLRGMEFRVWLLVANGLTDHAVMELTTYVDPDGDRSVWAAVEVPNGTDDARGVQATFDRFRTLDAEEVAATGYWGGEFVFKVNMQGASA